MDVDTLQSNPEKDFSKLPSHATEESRMRYAIAQSLANMAPPSFGQESVVTGSTSRGIVDALTHSVCC